MTRRETRILSTAAGLLLLAIAIVLENAFSAHEKEVQIAVWTLITVTMAILGNRKHWREQWFRKGFVLGSLLHVAILYKFWESLPFHDLGPPILLAFAEVLFWQVIFRSLSVKGKRDW